MKRLKKSICLVANLSLLLNNFLPLILFAKPAYAQSVEENPAEIIQETPTLEPTPTTQSTPIPEAITNPETTVTPEPTITPEVTITPEPIVTPEITQPTIIEPTPTTEATESSELEPIQSGEFVQPTPTVTVDQPISTPETNTDQNQDAASPTSAPEATPTNENSEPPQPTPTVTITPPSPILPVEGEIETTVMSNNVTRTDLLNPSLSTDKPDYHPTEIAIISGHGFLSNTEYFLHITSDGIDQTYRITSDSNGSFTYSYQLDDVYRPEYQVEAKNQSGEIVDAMTFTDSRWVTLASLNDNLFVQVQPNQSVSAKVTVSTWNGILDWNNDWRSTQYTIPGQPPVCVDTVNHDNTGFHTESFNVTAPSDYGIYNITFQAFSNNDCTGGFINTPLTLLAAITVVDTTPPETTITSTPDSLIKDRNASFSFTSNESGFTECKLDNGSYFLCNSPKTYTNLSDGSHTFSVRAIDTWLNVGQPSTYTWTIDNVGPVITLQDYTTQPTNQDITVIASIIEGEFITESSHIFTANDSFEFKAKDSLGNVSSLTVTVTNIDKTLPIVTFGENNPTGLTNQNDQTFTVSVDELVKTCKINFAGNYAERQIEDGLSDGSGFSYIIGGDDTGTYYTLPFPFSFYGNYYNQVGISTNGLIRFNSLNTSYPGSVSQLRSQTAVTPFWQDIVTNIYAQSSSDDVRFRWTGYGWSTGGYLTGETVLRSNGQIEFHYGNINLPSRPITAGISAGNDTDYVLSSTNGQSYISQVSYAYAPGFEGTYDMVKGEDGKYSVTVEDITDGNVAYSVTCTDLAGNDGQTESRNFIVDTQAPTLSSKTDFGDSWYSTDQTSEFVFSDPNGVVSGNNPTCSISTEGPQQTCTVDQLNVCDTAGNCNTGSVTSNGANIDKASPIIDLLVNPENPDADNGWYKTRPAVSAQASDANLSGFFYQWNSNAGDWTEYTNSLLIPTEGVHTLYLRAIDLAGNFTLASQTLKWDQTVPELGPQNISANPNPTSGSTSKIKWEFAKDNVGIDKYEIKWKLNNDDDSTEYSITVGAGTTEVEVDQLTEGRWTVRVIAFDQSGHQKDNAIDLIVDRSGPSAPILTLNSVDAGIANLSWAAIEDAKDYIVWYGNTPGTYLYGARVGNVTSYTVRGLGAGNYYFIVKAVDEAQNQSSNSNEVNTGNITGAAGTVPNQPAEGFSPEVKGDSTQDSSSDNPLQKILGIGSEKNGFNKWWLLLLLIPTYFIGHKLTKKKK